MKPASVAKIAPILLALMVSAYDYESEIGAGDAAQTHSYDLFTAANENPNATNSVTFNPFPSGFTSSVQWTWRVNVSDVSVPDATVQEGAPSISPDPHVVNVVYDLSWPGSGDIDQAAANGLNISSNSTSGAPLCGFVIQANLPPNVTDLYSASDNSQCNSALGSQCVSSILSSLQPNAGSCPTFSGVAGLIGCDESFGLATTISTLSFELATANATSGGDNYQSGQGFFYSASAAHPAANATTYQDAVSGLQVMLVTGPTSSQLLCQRVGGPVNTTSPTTPSASNSATTSPSPSPSQGAAAGSSLETSGAFTVVLLGVVALLFGTVL